MTREEALEHFKEQLDVFGGEHAEAIKVAIEGLKGEGCEGCRYNTRTPQKRCLRCKRYWRDSYERKGGDTE